MTNNKKGNKYRTYLTKNLIIKGPGVARAILQSPP